MLFVKSVEKGSRKGDGREEVARREGLISQGSEAVGFGITVSKLDDRSWRKNSQFPLSFLSLFPTLMMWFSLSG